MILLLDNPKTENRRQEILYWAEQYEQKVDRAEWELENELLELREKVHQDKHLTRDQLETLVRWKMCRLWPHRHVCNIRKKP